MLLVDRLAGDPERLGDVRPRPAVEHGPLDRGVLDAIREAAQSADGGERVGWVVGEGGGRGNHFASTIVDTHAVVNLGC